MDKSLALSFALQRGDLISPTPLNSFSISKSVIMASADPVLRGTIPASVAPLSWPADVAGLRNLFGLCGAALKQYRTVSGPPYNICTRMITALATDTYTEEYPSSAVAEPVTSPSSSVTHNTESPIFDLSITAHSSSQATISKAASRTVNGSRWVKSSQQLGLGTRTVIAGLLWMQDYPVTDPNAAPGMLNTTVAYNYTQNVVSSPVAVSAVSSTKSVQISLNAVLTHFTISYKELRGDALYLVTKRLVASNARLNGSELTCDTELVSISDTLIRDYTADYDMWSSGRPAIVDTRVSLLQVVIPSMLAAKAFPRFEKKGWFSYKW